MRLPEFRDYVYVREHFPARICRKYMRICSRSWVRCRRRDARRAAVSLAWAKFYKEVSVTNSDWEAALSMSNGGAQ